MKSRKAAVTGNRYEVGELVFFRANSKVVRNYLFVHHITLTRPTSTAPALPWRSIFARGLVDPKNYTGLVLAVESFRRPSLGPTRFYYEVLINGIDEKIGYISEWNLKKVSSNNMLTKK